MNLPNLHLSKRTKIILLSLLATALLGGISYGGYLCLRNHQSAPDQQPSVSEPGTPITGPTDDPNWNLYINEEYGFSVEYPAGWEVSLSELLTRITFGDPNNGYLSVETRKFEYDLLVDWLRSYPFLVELSSSAHIPDEANAIIGGADAYVVYSPSDRQVPDTVTTVLSSGDRVFRLIHGRWGDSVGQPLLWDIYEHFLRTLEFEGTTHIPDELPEFPMGF